MLGCGAGCVSMSTGEAFHCESEEAATFGYPRVRVF
jgi:hypothetical protein